jgi:hypothetical protein
MQPVIKPATKKYRDPIAAAARASIRRHDRVMKALRMARAR